MDRNSGAEHKIWSPDTLSDSFEQFIFDKPPRGLLQEMVFDSEVRCQPIHSPQISKYLEACHMDKMRSRDILPLRTWFAEFLPFPEACHRRIRAVYIFPYLLSTYPNARRKRPDVEVRYGPRKPVEILRGLLLAPLLRLEASGAALGESVCIDLDFELIYNLPMETMAQRDQYLDT